MADQELDPNASPCLHLVSAFIAMEPTDSLITLARACGGGSITGSVQRFIWDYCVNTSAQNGYAPHLRNFLKKLIKEVESSCGDVLDELYEECAHCMISSKDDDSTKVSARVCKFFSFLFPDVCFELPSSPRSRKLVFPLQCSLNMLEGDTGCSIWPSSLFLSEFILSFPDMFSNKSCFEVGSGVGLVGICLSHVKASKVILSDGDLSTLANMKLNLELNKLTVEIDSSESASKDPNAIKCIHLRWESVSESEIKNFMPEIVLGADVIYDPSCLPHLVQVLGTLLNRVKSYPQKQEDSCCRLSLSKNTSFDGKVICNNIEHNIIDLDKSDSAPDYNSNRFSARQVRAVQSSALTAVPRQGPVAYIASVIRNVETFNYFLTLADGANLEVIDITETLRPFNLLPYMRSYDRNSIRLFTVACK